METPTIHEEEEMEEFDEEINSVVGSQDPSSSTGAPNRPTTRPHTAVRSRLGRQTLVCRECKRLKLKCNRRTPCDQCMAKKRECVYDPGAQTKIDVQSVHNTQIRHQFLLEAITHLLGIPEDEVQMIMNAPAYPPRPDYTGPTVDVKRLRTLLGIESTAGGESIPRNTLGITDLFALASTGRNALLPPAIVTFSRPPPQVPNPSATVFNGGSSITPRRSQIPSVMVDLATRVFQANSIVVSHHVLAQLQLWMRVLGWEPRTANEGSIPTASIKPVATFPSSTGEGEMEEDDGEDGGYTSRGRQKKADNHTVLVTAPPSEIEYYNEPKPKNLSILALVHEVFIDPAQKHAAASNNHAISPPSTTFSALSYASSSTSTSSPKPSFPHGVPPSITIPRSSLSPPPSVLPLVTPQIVQRYLPPKAWRVALMHEFDILMINHDGIGLSGRHSVLKKRMELMFEWAEGCMKRLGSSGGDSSFDSGSTFSSSSSSRGRRSGSTSAAGRGRGGRPDGKEFKPLPPPPTLGLFAVACAVYALGALSYASKSIHGRFPEDEDEAERHQDAAGGSAMGSAAMTGMGQSASMPPPSFVPGVGGPPPNPQAPPMNPSLMNFALTGDQPASWTLNMGDLPGRQPAPTAAYNPHTHPLSDKALPHNLLNLARAALLVHDESALPASLDYLHAHMLTWLYLLHPSDSASSVTACGFQDASTGVGSGGTTVVDQTIYKELGKCVSVARGLGLDLVDRPSGRRAGAGFGRMVVDDAEDEDDGMGVWEKEMRRRVWWQLMMFDQQISENLGRLPLIPPGTYACKPPSEADESVFGPTATAIPKPPETAKGYNTTFFAMKCQLLAIIKTLSYAQLEEGVTMDLARQLDTRLSNWRSALPAQYKIEFREKAEDTTFPSLDTVDVQACDLHITANVFLLRLWLPFFNEALSSTSQSNQGVLLTATTAANAVIVASNHLVTRFRAARPMSFGHYDFGNSVWFATGILASVVTMKSDVIFSSTARRGVEMAEELFRNQVVEGKSDSNYKPKYEVNRIMEHVTRLVAEVPKGKKSTGSKRKSDADVGQMKMRYGVPLPYTGTAAMTTATDINEPQAQSALRPESNYVRWRSPQLQDSDDMSSHSASQSRRRMHRILDPAPSSDVEPLPGSHSMDEGSVVASAFAAEMPVSRPSSVASRMSTSQAGSSQSGRSRPAVGVRVRTPSRTGASPIASGFGTDLPPEQKRTRADDHPSGMSGGEEPMSSHSPHNPPYPPPSTLPEAPVMTVPPNQISTMHPPPIHKMSAPNPVFHQGRHFQPRHDSSPNVTIGNYHAESYSQPQSAVPPGAYYNPSSQGQPPPTPAPFPYFPQAQPRPNSAIATIDTRSQMHPSQSYASPASALSHPPLPAGHQPTDAYLTNLQAPGGPPVPHHSESMVQSAGDTHMSSQEHLVEFDLSGMLPISTTHPSILQSGGPSHPPPLMHEGQQFASQPQAHQHQQYPVGPITGVTWTSVPGPQSHSAPSHPSQPAQAQGWTPTDPNSMHYMGPHHP